GEPQGREGGGERGHWMSSAEGILERGTQRAACRRTRNARLEMGGRRRCRGAGASSGGRSEIATCERQRGGGGGRRVDSVRGSMTSASCRPGARRLNGAWWLCCARAGWSRRRRSRATWWRGERAVWVRRFAGAVR